MEESGVSEAAWASQGGPGKVGGGVGSGEQRSTEQTGISRKEAEQSGARPEGS